MILFSLIMNSTNQKFHMNYIETNVKQSMLSILAPTHELECFITVHD